MEMDKDIIDFNGINIKTKTIPFKTQNSILRWRTAVFVLISILILIIFCLILKSTNTSYNKKHNLYEEISTNSTAIQSELDELNKEINEEKEKYTEMNDQLVKYEQSRMNLKKLQQLLDERTGDKINKERIKAQKTEEDKKKLEEVTLITKEYQNLINENNKLKKEYFELGGK